MSWKRIFKLIHPRNVAVFEAKWSSEYSSFHLINIESSRFPVRRCQLSLMTSIVPTGSDDAKSSVVLLCSFVKLSAPETAYFM